MRADPQVTSWGGRLTRQFDKITNGKKCVRCSRPSRTDGRLTLTLAHRQLGLARTVRAGHLEALPGGPGPRRAHQGRGATGHGPSLRCVPDGRARRARHEAATRIRVLREGRAHVRHPRHGAPSRQVREEV